MDRWAVREPHTSLEKHKHPGSETGSLPRVQLACTTLTDLATRRLQNGNNEAWTLAERILILQNSWVPPTREHP